MNIGGGEIIGLFLLALLLFGPKRLPDIGRNVGHALREMRKMSSELTSAFTEAMEEPKRTVSTAWNDDTTEDPYASVYNDSSEWREDAETDDDSVEESSEADSEIPDIDEDTEQGEPGPAADVKEGSAERNSEYGSD